MRRLVVAVAVSVLVAPACSSSDGPDTPEGTASFCDAVATLTERIRAATSGPEDLDGLRDARDVAEQIGEAAARVHETMPETVPEDVREATERLTSLTIELSDELAGFYQDLVDDPDRASDPEFLSEFRPVTEERRAAIEEASASVRPYVARECETDVQVPETDSGDTGSGDTGTEPTGSPGNG